MLMTVLKLFFEAVLLFILYIYELNLLYLLKFPFYFSNSKEQYTLNLENNLLIL